MVTKRRVVSFGLSLVIMLIAFAEVFNVRVVAGESEDGISFPDESRATITGFSYKKALPVTFNCSQPSAWDPGISTSSIVGYCVSYIGSYKKKDKVDGDYYDALLIKTSMEPATFYGLKGKTYYGFSQYVEVSSILPTYCEYQSSSPNNTTTGGDQYSISIAKGKGSGAELSGTINCNKQYCRIYDHTTDVSTTRSKFHVEFDYKTNVIDIFSTSARNNMLFGKTWQMSTCEWTTGRNPYNVKLDVKAGFGYASKKHGGGIYGPASTCTASATKTYSCYFVR